MLETYILKVQYPLKQDIYDLLARFVSPERRSDLLRRKNRQSAEASLIGEAMAKLSIKKHFGIPVENQHFLREEQGKPYLEGYPNIHFNISHSGKFVVCAVSDAPVGVDVQVTGEYKPRVAKRICSEQELEALCENGEEFTKLWTQKEAVLKLKGTGFTDKDIKNCISTAKIQTERFDNCYISIATNRL